MLLVVQIPCSNCNDVYVDETGRAISKRLVEHKRSVRYVSESLGIFVHIRDKGHTINWRENTNFLVQKSYKRLEILRKLYKFNVPILDLVHIYTLYVRSILEFNCCVWHFSITVEEAEEIERVQKIALKLILRNKYISYKHALQMTDLETLEERRLMLC